MPLRFTGKLDKLGFNLEPQQLTAEERHVMVAMSQRNDRASEWRRAEPVRAADSVSTAWHGIRKFLLPWVTKFL